MSIPGAASPLFLSTAAGGAAAGYAINRSLRFNSGDSSFLSRTPSSAGNRKTFTYSAWAKRSNISTTQNLFGIVNAATQERFQFGSNSYGLAFVYAQGASSLITSALLRDVSAWYHIVLAVDTDQGTASNRVKIYINGALQTVTGTYPSSGYQFDFNNSIQHRIGSFSDGTGNYHYADYYLADVHLIDGQALTPSDFGEYDTNNVWQPIEFAGTYGPLVDQSQTWSDSSNTSGNVNTSGNYTPVNMFNGILGNESLSGAVTFSTYSSNSSMTWTSPVTFSNLTSLRLFVDKSGTGAGFLRVNGNNYDSLVTDGWVTIPESSLSTIQFGYTGGLNTATGMAAVEVNGQLLIDSGVTAPNNSFHLPFSDNSSNAALGTDTSSKGNTWTVNNLAAASADYVTGRFTGTERTDFEWEHLFDGNTAQGAVPSANSNFVWTPASSIAFTTLAVYAYKDSSPGGLEINGTSVISQIPNHGGVGSNQRTVITGISSPLASLKNISLGNLANVVIGGIEIDGVLLQNSETDSLVDTPEQRSGQTDSGSGGDVVGNYCTWNAVSLGTDATLSDGNLKIAYGASGTRFGTVGTFGMTSGKWYWEAEITASSSTNTTAVLGISSTSSSSSLPNYPGFNALSWGYVGEDGSKYHSATGATYGDSYGVGDVIGVAFDADNGDLYFYKNGTVQNSGTAAYTNLTSGPYFPAIGDGSATNTFTSVANFGQRAFAYTAPSGYKALCVANLSEPTIADGSQYFDTKLYVGNGSTQTVSGYAFSPDFAWLKKRSSSGSHSLHDVIRGATKRLSSDSTSAETTETTAMTAFNSDGFSLGSGGNANASGQTFAAWAWDGGSSTVTNTDGSISAQVRAQPSAGFSSVSYVGTGSLATIGHGLGAKPFLRIIKRRDATSTLGWMTFHESAPTSYFTLNSTNAATPASEAAPTSTVFSLPSDANSNANGGTYVAYCFAPVEGYSSMGSYTGNGSADGPFVFTGFRPRWILLKNTQRSDSPWVLFDTAREPDNVITNSLEPNTSDAEDTQTARNIDALSNGFKIRGTSVAHNNSGHQIVYIAFAEHPFRSSRAR